MRSRAFGYQLTHLTKEKDCLHHDDRVDGLSGLMAAFADVLGVDPQMMAQRASQDRADEEWEKRSLVTSEPSCSALMTGTTITAS